MTASPTSASTVRFSHPTLIAARVAGALIAGVSVWLFILALPAHIAHLQSIYSPDAAPARSARAGPQLVG